MRPVWEQVHIVDDNIHAADTLARLLDTLGCEMRTAYDGEAALHEAAAIRRERASCRRTTSDSGWCHVSFTERVPWQHREEQRRAKHGADH